MKSGGYVNNEFKKMIRYYKLRNFKNKLILSIMLILVVIFTISIFIFLTIFNAENNYNSDTKSDMKYIYSKF